MERKYYKVKLEFTDFDKDTSKMCKDYDFIKNLSVTEKCETKATYIVYEENGVFREFLSGFQITSVAQSTICETSNNNQIDQVDKNYNYKYDIKGIYPVFFRYNVTPEIKNITNVPTLEELEVDETYVNYTKNLIIENYKTELNWKIALFNFFEQNLIIYHNTLEKNGYSEAYKKQILNNPNVEKSLWFDEYIKNIISDIDYRKRFELLDKTISVKTLLRQLNIK